MGNPPSHAVLFCDAAGRRQVAAFSNTQGSSNIKKYMTADLDGTWDGDWIQLPTDSAVNSAIQRAGELGGTVYNMPVR